MSNTAGLTDAQERLLRDKVNSVFPGEGTRFRLDSPVDLLGLMVVASAIDGRWAEVERAERGDEVDEENDTPTPTEEPSTA